MKPPMTLPVVTEEKDSETVVSHPKTLAHADLGVFHGFQVLALRV